MTALAWDQTGERIYQSGIDRGVLYLQEGLAVPWNGLISIEESTATEIKSFYLDGVKYLETLAPKDFSAKLKAFTYPDEFDSVNGIVSVVPGFDAYDQPSKSFNLSYRTKIGDDVDGIEHGYKIHILYNVIANPDPYSFNTLSDSGIQPVEFGWTLTGTPPAMSDFRPTVHVSIDSTETPPEVLEILENQLYGTITSAPSLPTFQQISEYFGYLGALIIIDNGDGSWTAIDESNGYIIMLDETTFQIENANAEFTVYPEYQISSTNVV
jgi:hypothetical protein